MRVRVTIPSDYCEFLETEPVVLEGWIRWRTEVGPRVWYYTRGC